MKKEPAGEMEMDSSFIELKKMGGDFTLQTMKDKKEVPWSLSESNGKIRILYFGFTFCPDVCPTSLTKLIRLFKNFSEEERNQILPVFISVDYKRDNAQRVDRYTKYYSSSIVGLAGTKEKIEAVAKQFGVYFKMTKQDESALRYTIDHTSRYFLVDKNGDFLNSYSTSDQEFVKALRKLLEKS